MTTHISDGTGSTSRPYDAVHVMSGAMLVYAGSQAPNGTGSVMVSGGHIEIFEGVKGPASLDSATFAQNAIEYEHHEIHEGNHFYICDFETLASGGSVSFNVNTPDTTKWTHMIWDITGTAQTELRIFEGAVGSGEAITILNNDRNSVNSSTLTIWKNGSISAPGTEIFAASKGLEGTTPASASQLGQITRGREFILKSGTLYNFKISSASADNVVSYCGEWYEHTNKL